MDFPQQDLLSAQPVMPITTRQYDFVFAVAVADDAPAAGA
jgi:hypothetical protein